MTEHHCSETERAIHKLEMEIQLVLSQMEARTYQAHVEMWTAILRAVAYPVKTTD